MPDTPVTIYHDLAGISSPTLLIYPLVGGAAANGSGDALAQAADGEFAWEAVIAESLTGTYRYEVVSASTAIAWGFVALANTEDRCHGEYTRAAAEIGGQLAALLIRSERVDGMIEDEDGDRWTPHSVSAVDAGEGGGGYTGLTSAEIAAIRDAILNRVLSTNHESAGTPGKILQELVTGLASVNQKLVTTFVAVISHQRPSGKIVLVRGDDFVTANGHFLSWKNADGSGWPASLSGTEVVVNFAAVHVEYEGTPTADVPSTHKIVATGSVHQATTPNQEIRVELPKAKTDVTEGLYNYDVEIVIDGVTTTLVTTAKPDLTEPQFTTAISQDDKLEVLPHFAQASA